MQAQYESRGRISGFRQNSLSKFKRHALLSAAGGMGVRHVKKLKDKLGSKSAVVRGHPLVAGHPDGHPSGPGKPLQSLHSKSDLLLFQHPNIFNNKVGSGTGFCGLGSPLGLLHAQSYGPWSFHRVW